MLQQNPKSDKPLTPKERVLLAMDGGKPDQIPAAMMTDWDYKVRAGGGDPYDWMYSCDPSELRRRVGNDLCITGWTYELDMIRNDRAAIARTIRHQIETTSFYAQ
jgi:hypothetical protein